MTTLSTRPTLDDTSRGPAPTDVRSATFDALGHRFAVAAEDGRTVALAETAFGALAVRTTPAGWYQIRRRADRVEVSWNDTAVGVGRDRADTLALLRGDVQRRAIAAADDDLVLRAGGVEIDGRAVVVSGSRRCGASTLLAALVAEGCTYLGDDAFPVELRSGRVRRFPQPLLLDDHSLDMLPEIAALRSAVHCTTGRRLVVPSRIRATREPATHEVSMVLFPERDDSGISMLRPVVRDEAVVRLAENSYNFPGREQDAIEAMHRLVRNARAFAVVGGDPHSSARAVLDALAPLT